MLIAPETRRGIVFRHTETPYGYQGWPSVCRMDDGTLLAVCSGYRLHHICPFGKTIMNVSFDDGETWSPPAVINDTPLDDRDAGVLSCGGQRLLVTWFSHPAQVYLSEYASAIKNTGSLVESALKIAQLGSYYTLPEEKARGGSFVRLSQNGGMTWGDAVRVPVSAPHGPTRLRDGSLLYLGKEMYSHGEEKPGAVAAYASPDGGITWERRGEVSLPDGLAPHNFHEPHVVELPDGRLFGAIRAQSTPVYHGFTMYACHSSDGGRTWTVPRSLDVSGSPPHLLLHSSGALICSFGRREAPCGERAIVSYDNGETWRDEYVLHEAQDGDLGYPASVELPDGSIFTLYYQKWENDAKPSILYTKWRL